MQPRRARGSASSQREILNEPLSAPPSPSRNYFITGGDVSRDSPCRDNAEERMSRMGRRQSDTGLSGSLALPATLVKQRQRHQSMHAPIIVADSTSHQQRSLEEHTSVTPPRGETEIQLPRLVSTQGAGRQHRQGHSMHEFESSSLNSPQRSPAKPIKQDSPNSDRRHSSQTDDNAPLLRSLQVLRSGSSKAGVREMTLRRMQRKHSESNAQDGASTSSPPWSPSRGGASTGGTPTGRRKTLPALPSSPSASPARAADTPASRGANNEPRGGAVVAAAKSSFKSLAKAVLGLSSLASKAPEKLLNTVVDMSQMKKPSNTDRETKHDRRKTYSDILEEKMKVVLTHVNLRTKKGLVIVSLFDLSDMRKAFDVLDKGGVGKVHRSDVLLAYEAASSLREQYEGGGLSEAEWCEGVQRFKLLAIPMDELGMKSPLLEIILKNLKDGPLSWAGMLLLAYPHATKEGLRNMITALEEFMRLPNPPKRDDGPTLKERKDLDGMWGLFDLDGSGELDRYEFKLAMAMLNIHTNLGFLEVYNALDTDGNGTISKDEFAVWWFDGSSMVARVSADDYD